MPSAQADCSVGLKVYCARWCNRGSQLHFFFCAVTILVSYMYFGVLQEKVFQSDYSDGDRFTFTFSVLFIGTCCSTCYATLMLYGTGVKFQEKTPKRLFIPLAFTHLMSLCTTVGSLQRVSYPVMVVVKAVKPIFVMLCAALIGKVRYSAFKYATVCVAVCGVMLFMYNAPAKAECRPQHFLAASDADAGGDGGVAAWDQGQVQAVLAVRGTAGRGDESRARRSDAANASATAPSGERTPVAAPPRYEWRPASNCSTALASGRYVHQVGWSTNVLLLFASLVFDGLTAGQQERLKAEYATGGYTMMFFMDALMSVYLLVPLGLTNEFAELVRFCTKHAAVVLHIVCMVALNVLGQSFVFVVIDAYGTLPCALVTTARKFLTVLFSILFFAHAVTWRQFAGAALVFGALIFGELNSYLESRAAAFYVPKCIAFCRI